MLLLHFDYHKVSKRLTTGRRVGPVPCGMVPDKGKIRMTLNQAGSAAQERLTGIEGCVIRMPRDNSEIQSPHSWRACFGVCTGLLSDFRG